MDLKQAIEQSLTKHRQGINDATLYWAIRVEHPVNPTKEEFESQLSLLLIQGKVQRKLNNRLYPVQAPHATRKLSGWERSGN